MENYRRGSMRVGLLPIFVAIAICLATFAWFEISYAADYEVVQSFRASYFTSPTDGQTWCGWGYMSTSCGTTGGTLATGGQYQRLEQDCTYASISWTFTTGAAVNESAESSSLGFTVLLDDSNWGARASSTPYYSSTLMTVKHSGLNPGTAFHSEKVPVTPIYKAWMKKGNWFGVYITHPTWTLNPTNVLTDLEVDCYATKSNTVVTYLTPDDMEGTENWLMILSVGLGIALFLKAMSVGFKITDDR